MYGVMPTTVMTATTAPRSVDCPYRDPRKSAIDVMLLALAIRTVLRSTHHHVSAIRVGPR